MIPNIPDITISGKTIEDTIIITVIVLIGILMIYLIEKFSPKI